MTNEEFIKKVSIEGEEWRDVVGYEEHYMVSSYGRLMSKGRELDIPYLGTTRIKTLNPELMMADVRQTKNRNYFQANIKLHKDCVKKGHIVARVVATTFIPNPNNLPEVDHINGISTDNWVSNLRWVTRTENTNNPTTKEKIHNRRAVVQLKDGILIKEWPTLKSAEVDGFNHSKISMCCSGKNKNHKGYQWMYKSDYDQLVNTEQSN